MPRSHHCISCGHDLSWIKAPPDPHYGLAVVVCPTCDRACTRSKIQITRSTRAVRLIIRTMVSLGARALMLTLLVLLPVTLAWWLGDQTMSPRSSWAAITTLLGINQSNQYTFDDPADFRTPFMVLILFSIGVGVWMRGAHGHLGTVKALLLWVVLAFGALALSIGAQAIESAVQGMNIFSSYTYRMGIMSTLVYLAAMIPGIALGVPIGKIARNSWTRQHTKKAHTFRRKLRKHRMNHARPADC